MRKIMFLVVVIALMILSGCQTYETAKEMEDENMDSTDEIMKEEESMIEHIGCQEGEIDEFGNCWPAEQSMASVFIQGDVAPEDVEHGFLAKPEQEGDYPGIIMIHEWWGLNDNVKDMAKVLAKEGYVVYAVDLYNGQVASDSNKAGELAGYVRSNPEEAIQVMKNAVAYLKEQGAQSIGSIGWCFGGGFSLQLALNEEMGATVIYYGQLTDDKEQLKNIKWPVLGMFGSEDTSITPESVRRFESALNELGIENDINIYERVGHAFANPSGSRYAQEEAIDAWEKTVKFLDDNLKISGKDISMKEAVPSSGIVEIKGFAFNPATVTIGAGGTITWTNKDSVRHTATSDDRLFDSGLLSNEENWSYTFDKKGTYNYHCTPHPYMEGTVVVK